jgi:hypothetical protein
MAGEIAEKMMIKHKNIMLRTKKFLTPIFAQWVLLK